jgi:hypothetical protein
LINLSTPKC